MSKVQTGNLFTDAEMALFGVVQPKAKRGRGLTPGTVGYRANTTIRRQSIYSVRTTGHSASLNRDYTLPLFGGFSSPSGKLYVSVGGDVVSRIGHNFATVSIRTQDGRWSTVIADASTLRNMAQVFNAAANSCCAEWRKSSIIS